MKISSEMREDLKWWKCFLRIFNGKRTLEYNVTTHYIYVDACERSGACFYNGDWVFINWKTDYPNLKQAHINVKEAMMVLIASWRWASVWCNSKVIVRIDNFTAASAISKGTSKSAPVMNIVRQLFWVAVCHNFDIKCWFLPGCENILADSLSRLFEIDKLNTAAIWLHWKYEWFKLMWPVFLLQHMSYKTFLLLIPQVIVWLSLGKNGGTP